MTNRNPAADSNAAAATDGRFAGKTDNLADRAEVAVSASGVSKRFKVKETSATVLALDNVDVQVATGQLTAIVGP
ncbi:MAG: ATP-binding cassette domain-containing protein, partial [Advenella sp.]